MSDTQACPSQTRWQQHLEGTLSAEEQSELTQHLDHCETCQKTLELLGAGGDSLLQVAEHAGQDATADESGVREVLEKLKKNSTGDETKAETPPLAPPSQGGERRAPSPPCEGGETGGSSGKGKDDASLRFLAPAKKEGSLGRLGHYEVLEILGKGGFGTVFKAFDEKLHRVVAIKVLAPELAASGPAKKRFLREAKTAASVRHENVIGIHAVDETPPASPPWQGGAGGGPYLVMECIEGQTLQDKIDKTGPLPVKEILRIGYQTALGLAAAHVQGLIHRDIKPGNILLENGVERVKITDFGLARAVDDASVTQSGVVSGTPAYMSPEQAEGLVLDHRSDLFSLGSTLYIMCTGRPPFRASGTMAVLKRVIEDTPRPIHEINGEIPDWLCDIIAKLHAKKPEDRCQSAQEVAGLLASYLSELQLHGGVAPISGRVAGAEALRNPGKVQEPPPAAGTSKTQPRPPSPEARPEHASYNAFLGVLLPYATRAPVGMNVFRLHIVLLWGVLIFLYFLNDWLRIYRVIPNPRWAQHFWLPLFFIQLYFLGWIASWFGPRLRYVLGWIVLLLALPVISYLTFRGATRIGESDNARVDPSFHEEFNLAIRAGRDQLTDEDKWTLAGHPLSFQLRDPDTRKLITLFATLPDEVHQELLQNGHLIWKFTSLDDAKKKVYEDALQLNLDLARKQGVERGATLSLEALHKGEVGFAVVKISGKSAQVVSWFILLPEHPSPIWVTVVGAGHAGTPEYFAAHNQQLPTLRSRALDADSTRKSPPHAIAPFDAKQALSHQEAWAKHLGVPAEITNTIGMKLRLIPPGEFMMGSSLTELQRGLEELKMDEEFMRNNPGADKHVQAEGPQHPVKITKPFFVGVHEVTVDQFRRFVDDTGYQTEPETNGTGGLGRSADGTWERRPEFNWRDWGIAQEGDHPVSNVTWNDAQEFCRWLSNKEGKKYRLLSEAEWEYACRAGTASRWFWGDDKSEMGKYAVVSPGMPPSQVGQRLPNPFGLHDVYGGVTEFCQDTWHEKYYASSPLQDPVCTLPAGSHALRGGNRGGTAKCYSAGRHVIPDGLCFNLMGFRVARTAD